MKKRFLAPLLIGVWLSGAYVNTGLVLANLVNEFPHTNYRSHLAFAVGWSLIPVAWVVCPFVTGLYEYGWMRPTLHPQRSLNGEAEPKR